MLGLLYVNGANADHVRGPVNWTGRTGLQGHVSAVGIVVLVN